MLSTGFYNTAGAWLLRGAEGGRYVPGGPTASRDSGPDNFTEPSLARRIAERILLDNPFGEYLLLLYTKALVYFVRLLPVSTPVNTARERRMRYAVVGRGQPN